MEKRQETTIVWPMWGTNTHEQDEAGTNVVVSSLATARRPYICRSVKSVSVFTPRRISFEVVMQAHGRKDYSLTADDRTQLWGFFQKLGDIQQGFETRDDPRFNQLFRFVLPLQGGQEFAERSVELVDILCTILGIQDPLKRIRGNFEITQKTQVRREDAWIYFEEWLRGIYGLSPPYVYYWTN